MLTTTCALYIIATLAAALDMDGTARINTLFVLAVLTTVAAAALR